MVDASHSPRLSGSSLPKFAATLGALCLGATLAAGPALALGGGGANSGSGNSGAGASGTRSGSDRSTGNTPMTLCPKGQVWAQKMNKCVRAQSAIVPDESLTEYAYALAKAKRYGEAIDMLDLLQNPDTPRALNYRGYATRKLGRTEEGIRYYLQSVALDPQYAQVREYLGEAYTTQGKIGLAKEQLRTIESLCGTGCEEYRDLAKAIAAAPKL